MATLKYRKADGTFQEIPILQGEKGEQGEAGTTDYNELTNKPVIDSAMSASSTNAVQNMVVKAYVDTAIGTTSNLLGDTEDLS